MKETNTSKAAKRIESRLDEKRATIEHAFETLKNERLLLRQERQAVHNLQVSMPRDLNDSGHQIPAMAPIDELFPPIVPIPDYSDDLLNLSIPPLQLNSY